MVHVVPCHHFVSQDVFLSNQEPVAFCCAQSKIMMATCKQTVNVHSLDSRGSILHSFATVDVVEQMVYCDVGNFLVMLERRATKNVKTDTCVRVYFNWWMEAKTHSVKVHVAGSSIPTLYSHSDQFEAVELPLNENATCVACCKTTAVLGVGLGKKISVFCYCLRSSDNSKSKQHDFSHFIDMELNIIVKEMNICEGYFACMSDKQLQVFKVSIEKENNPNLPSESTGTDGKQERTDSIGNRDPNLDEHFIEWKFESCTPDGATDVEWENTLNKHLHPSSFPVTVTFPLIEKHNQNSDFSPRSCEIIGPVLTTLGHKINVKLDSRFFELWPALSSTNIDCVTFLFRQFELTEEQGKLMCLQLVPMYESDYSLKLDPLHAAAAIASETSFSQPWSPLISHFSSRLKALGCFFSTLKEGFMYDVTREVQLISTYHYTANLKCAIMDTSFLHALTDAGLETYSSHSPHCAIHRAEKPDGNKNACPDKATPVCLLGLRPFLGVSQLMISENYLILISSFEDADLNAETPESKNSTLYALKKPSPQQIFSDLVEICQMYKSSSPSTYQFVLSEGHMILQAHLFLTCNQDPEVDNLFRKSCILLGDYYACSSSASDKRTAVPYYHLSKLPFEEVVERLHGFHNQVKHSVVNKALMLYLSSVLLEDDYSEDRVVSKSIAEIILDVFMECSPDNLWRIILCSGLQGYKLEKAMLHLKRRITSKRHATTSASIAADTLAMSSLLLKKGNNEAAQTMLLSLPKGELVAVFSTVQRLVLHGGCLTQLGKFVKKVYPDAFIELLFHMAVTRKLKTSEIIDVLQKDDPDACAEKVQLLKQFLERLWIGDKNLFKSEKNCEVLLGEIFMSFLHEPVKENSSSANAIKSFVSGERPAWLNEMAPFNGRFPSSKCALTKSRDEKDIKETSDASCSCWCCNEYLLKLQCILSQKQVSGELKRLVLQSIVSNDFADSLSLKILCLPEDEAVTNLLELCPKAFLLYAKEMFGSDGIKWQKLFPVVQRKMQRLPESDPAHQVYSDIFNGVLMSLAEILSVPALISLLPPGENKFYAPYVKRCCERHQSLQLKNKIVALGNEIKAMM